MNGKNLVFVHAIAIKFEKKMSSDILFLNYRGLVDDSTTV